MRMRASKARSLGRDVGSKGTACISVTLFNVVSYYVSEELEKKLDIDLTISLSIRVWKAKEREGESGSRREISNLISNLIQA
jgi:hypothetical protein